MDPWIPSIVTMGALGFALWFGRELIATWLFKNVEYKFDAKLEAVRDEFRKQEEVFKTDLRLKENEIIGLRSGVMTAMISRQMALDKRRLEAVDELWSAVTALAGAKSISSFMAVTKFDAVAKEAVRNPEVREMFTTMGAAFDPNKLDRSGPEKARPFVSPMAWALFSAYQAIVMQAVLKVQIIKSGIGADLLDKKAVSKLVKAALPHQSEFIDKYGDARYHYLLEELEEALLAALRKMLAGEETDRANLDRANNILRLSKELTANQSKVLPNTGVQGRAKSGHFAPEP